jgi:hypothetical protein
MLLAAKRGEPARAFESNSERETKGMRVEAGG